MQGGHEAEEDGRGQRGQAGEGEGVRVHSDVLEARQGRGRGGPQRVDRPARDEEAQEPAGGGDEGALRQEQGGQAGPPGAERRADGHLALPRRRAHEDEVGHVREGDQHHQSNHGEQDEERAAEVGADDRLVQGAHGDGPPAVGVRILRPQA